MSAPAVIGDVSTGGSLYIGYPVRPDFEPFLVHFNVILLLLRTFVCLWNVMMFVFPRYRASFFHILWTFSVLFHLLEAGNEWVRTIHACRNPPDLLTTNESIRDDHHDHFEYTPSHVVGTETNESIDCIRYDRDQLLSLGTPPPGTNTFTDCGVSENLCNHLANLNILERPCPFHQPVKQRNNKTKRWKKRGKKRKQRNETFPISVHQSVRFNNNNNTQSLTRSNVNNLREIPKYNDRLVSIRMWNARSVREKTLPIYENICDS